MLLGVCCLHCLAAVRRSSTVVGSSLLLLRCLLLELPWCWAELRYHIKWQVLPSLLFHCSLSSCCFTHVHEVLVCWPKDPVGAIVTQHVVHMVVECMLNSLTTDQPTNQPKSTNQNQINQPLPASPTLCTWKLFSVIFRQMLPRPWLMHNVFAVSFSSTGLPCQGSWGRPPVTMLVENTTQP